jgi:hypothetical protein
MEMKHFNNEEWIDFVNQVAAHRKLELMRKHLGSCKACTKKMELWRKVRETAAPEGRFQPPAGTLRIVKSAFASAGMKARQKKSASVVEVLFDSLLQPALQGARSSNMATRQMLYRAGSYQLDIQIEVMPGGALLMVTGQLMDVSTPEMVSAGVRVALSDGSENLAYTVTNEFGEFRAEIVNSGDLEIFVPGGGGEPITISLRHALDVVPGVRHASLV